MQWEYKFWEEDERIATRMNELQMNALGKDKWEYCGLFHYDHGRIFIFKRPVRDL